MRRPTFYAFATGAGNGVRQWNWHPAGQPTGFPAALGDSQHLRIPPAAHTYQSDVETVHRLVEDEFFDLETFTSRGEFLAKAQTYQMYFNLVRPSRTFAEEIWRWNLA
jgi:hypothetical protein